MKKWKVNRAKLDKKEIEQYQQTDVSIGIEPSTPFAEGASRGDPFRKPIKDLSELSDDEIRGNIRDLKNSLIVQKPPDFMENLYEAAIEVDKKLNPTPTVSIMASTLLSKLKDKIAKYVVKFKKILEIIKS